MSPRVFCFRGRGQVESGKIDLQIQLAQAGDFHLGLEQADLERLVAVNRNNDPFPDSIFVKNVMAALDPGQNPALLAEKAAKLPPRDLLQTATSRSWEFLSVVRPEGSVSR